MKNLIPNLIAVAAIAALVASCSNELKVTDKWKEIPVVYGLLNQQDTVQYIRVQRGYLDENRSAVTVGGINDSIYYQNMQVQLQPIYISTGQPVGSPVTLTRVDGNLEGFPKASGVFSNAPNWLYKVRSANLASFTATTPNSTNIKYKLLLTNGDTRKTYTAETPLVRDIQIDNPLQTAQGLQWSEGRSINFKWTDPSIAINNKATISASDLEIEVQYDERQNNDPTRFVTKSIVWTAAKGLRPTNVLTGEFAVSLSNDAFTTFLATNIPENPDVYRCGSSIRIYVRILAAGDALSQFMTNYADNAGIASSDIFTRYSNISGDGRGVFSSRYIKRSFAFTLKDDVINEIVIGAKTRKLRFEGTSTTKCN